MRIHSLLTHKCSVQPSAIHGRGVSAVEPIKAGELVAVWGGKVYTTAEVSQLASILPRFATHPVSVYEGYYLGSENLFELDDAEYFNHSCEPNVGVRGQILVVARCDIATGQELTFDYDTTEVTADPFPCCCARPTCRQTIDGSSWRDPAFIERNKGYLSLYLEDRVRNSGPPSR